MIVQAFLRWAETARAGERAKAADALARAYLNSTLDEEQHRAAGFALTWLLDDPSPRVRLALAEALAPSPSAPRGLILSLAEDQPEIACTVITHSPVLAEGDLVDLVGRGGGLTRGFVAARPGLAAGVAAAIVEVGGEVEAAILLENETAALTRSTLRRIAERFGDNSAIRNHLLERDNLPADARHLLVGRVTAALAGSGLVATTMAPGRVELLMREAGDAAIVAIANSVQQDEIPALVEHLRRGGQLTPGLLMHALCTGRIDFFAGAVVLLSSLDEQRARAILATGRVHAVRALFEACGLDRDLAEAFVQAVLLWRKAAASTAALSISAQLLALLEGRAEPMSPVSAIREMVEKIHHKEMREQARSFASDVWLAA